MTEEQVPPYDLDAEESVLGSLLIENEAIFRVIDILEPADFYRDRNKWVYQACISLYKREERIDQVTVGNELKRQKPVNNTNRLEALGGSAYLSNLVLNVPTSVHCEYYAQIVKRLSIYREMIDVAQKIIGVAYEMPPDASAVIAQAQQEFGDIAQQVQSNEKHFVPLSEITVKASDYLDEQLKSGFMTGISTGYRKLDMAIGGYGKGTLTLPAGRPGMGKTQFMLESARRCAASGETVGIVSLEMTMIQLVHRLAFSVAGINRSKLREEIMTNRLDTEQRSRNDQLLVKAFEEIHELPIFINDLGRQTTQSIRTSVLRLSDRVPLEVVFVDHISLAQDWATDDVKRLDVISQELKNLARDLDIPVVALCQLNREVEKRPDKRPKLSDLRSSGGLEQNADVVLGLYRDAYYNPQTTTPNNLEVSYLKVRDGEAGNHSVLDYDTSTGSIKNGGLAN